MKCEGAGKPPRNLYKAVRHYRLRNNRPWYSTGWGECEHCRGGYCVRPLKSGQATVVHHKPISECTMKEQQLNLRRKMRWITYYNMNHFQGTGWMTSQTWAGPVLQHFNVVENSITAATTSLGHQVYRAPQTFRVEVQSDTPVPNGTGYIFHINDRVIVGPTNRMTMAVDYASWHTWNQTITVNHNAYLSMNQTWANWTNNITGGDYILGDYARQPAPAQPQRPQWGLDRYYARPIEDPIAREERRMREAEALFQRVEAQRLSRDEAQKNAHETLLAMLTPEQRAEYQTRKHFHIRGSKGTLYRILHGSSGNVRQVLSEADEGRGLHAYCAHPAMSIDQRTAQETGISAGHLPHEDAMLAQMLQLMVDEDSFLAVANRHW